jgi:hypothetical protein
LHKRFNFQDMPRCDKDFAFEDLGNAVRKVSLDLGRVVDKRLGIPTSAMLEKPCSTPLVLMAWPSVDGRWKIYVFCVVMEGFVLFFGWMKCRVLPARLSTKHKNHGRLGGCVAADSPRDVPAIFLEKQTLRNTKPA